MPIYEYKCDACEEVVEIIHGMSDSTPRTCDTCGAELSRLISRSSFALKGGGWYKDLYSSSKPKSDSGSSGKSDSGSSGKSDSGSSSKSDSGSSSKSDSGSSSKTSSASSSSSD